jgi:hypothetical protein
MKASLHGFSHFLRHDDVSLNRKVREFSTVQTTVGGSITETLGIVQNGTDVNTVVLRTKKSRLSATMLHEM